MKVMKWWMAAAILLAALPGYSMYFVTMLSETDHVLTTNADGTGAPLSDGTPVYIYWDQNNNGPDKADELAPACKAPPKCEAGSLSMNQFTLNGLEAMGEEGKFFVMNTFASYYEMPENPHYYLKVEGNGIVWYSNTFTPAEGPSEVDISSWRSDAGALSSPGMPDPLVITEYKLHDNYPNPFNNSTTLTYDLVNPEMVKLSVFNVLGQQVATLVNEPMTAGRHRMNFDATSLSTGVYMVRLEAGSFTALSKMLLLK